MTKAQLEARVKELFEDNVALRVERDGLVLKVAEHERKYAHEVGRLNGIIDNYRTELVRLGAQPAK